MSRMLTQIHARIGKSPDLGEIDAGGDEGILLIPEEMRPVERVQSNELEDWIAKAAKVGSLTEHLMFQL